MQAGCPTIPHNVFRRLGRLTELDPVQRPPANERARHDTRRRIAHLAARIMAEVQAAIHRATVVAQNMERALGRAWVERHPVGTFNAAYQGTRHSFKTTPLTGLPTHLQYLQG